MEEKLFSFEKLAWGINWLQNITSMFPTSPIGFRWLLISGNMTLSCEVDWKVEPFMPYGLPDILDCLVSVSPSFLANADLRLAIWDWNVNISDINYNLEW